MNINYMTEAQKRDMALLTSSVASSGDSAVTVYAVAEGKDMEQALRSNELMLEAVGETEPRASVRGINGFLPSVERQEEGVVDDWKRHIQNVLRVFSPDAFIMDGFGRLELFLRALKEFGFSPGKDIQVIGDSDFTPGLVMIRSDYREFIRSAAAVIHRIIEEPGYHCGIMEISGKIKRTPFKIEAL